jgi:hypothetical protein
MSNRAGYVCALPFGAALGAFALKCAFFAGCGFRGRSNSECPTARVPVLSNARRAADRPLGFVPKRRAAQLPRAVSGDEHSLLARFSTEYPARRFQSPWRAAFIVGLGRRSAAVGRRIGSISETGV